MGPLYCPRCRRPWYACTCRRKIEQEEKIDCSFICMPAFLNFDKDNSKKTQRDSDNGNCVNDGSTHYSTPSSFRDVIHQPHQPETSIFDEIVSSGSTVIYDSNENNENRNPNVNFNTPSETVVDDENNDDGVDSHLADDVDEQFLNDFLDEEKGSIIRKMEEKRSFIKTKLDYSRRFYFESNDQLLLNHNSFLRYSGISNFDVGYAWKNKVDRMDKFQLLCQLVNEMNQIKACCLQLYYRESAISVCPSRRIKLIQKYIGKSHENEFKTKTEREVKEFVWFLKIYKRRYLNVQERVKNVLGLDVEFIKSIKTYDDVYDYFIFNCNIKEINNNKM